MDRYAISIDHYSLIRKDSIRAQHGGMCMYVRDSISTTIIPEYDRDDVEILWSKLRPRRLPQGFSHLIVATIYHPPTADNASITNHIIDILSKIESSMPNATIIIALKETLLNSKFDLEMHESLLISKLKPILNNNISSMPLNLS